MGMLTLKNKQRFLFRIFIRYRACRLSPILEQVLRATNKTRLQQWRLLM
jgi:hypothetical protein